jgi:hypothetical protein
MSRRTPSGTPARALADALHGIDPEASTTADADRIANATLDALIAKGWHVTPADTAPEGALRCILLPDADPGHEATDVGTSPGAAFAHGVHAATDPDVGHTGKFGTADWGTAAVADLLTHGWHLVHVNNDAGEGLTVLYPYDEVVRHDGPGGRALRLRHDQDAVVFANNFDAEVDVLAAAVKLLQAEFLDADERGRIAIYLAERFAADSVTPEVERP